MSKFLFTIVFFTCFLSISSAQTKSKKEVPLIRILLIFDASNSMNAAYKGTSRIESAKLLFNHFVDSLQKLKNLELALRVYGHKKKFPPQDCNDTHLEIPFAKNNALAIKDKVKSLVPKGTTPIAHSLMEAIEDFPADPSLNIVILITDGIEECNGDPCDAAKRLLENGIILKPFIIGVGLSEQQILKLECVGDVFDISAPETFGSILNIIIKKTLNETTAQVNLLDSYDKATVTDVNMTFYNRKTNDVKYNIVHKMNSLNVSDTLRLKTSSTYKLVVNTIPKIEKDSIKLEVGRHNIISLKAAQGTLVIKHATTLAYNKTIDVPLCIIRKQGESNTLNIQKTNTTENYLVGSYAIEILTLPRIVKTDVNISSGAITTIDIPQAGTLRTTMNLPGFGSIYLLDKNELRWVCNMDMEQKNQSFNLQPGTYKIIFREKNSKKANQTSEETVTITSNEVKVIALF